jgi:acyl carrier protein
MDTRAVIFEQMRSVAEHQNKKLAPLTDELLLLDSGLDSLCIAILVANLEEELGKDPFSTGDETTMPVTVGDFVKLYADASV